MQLQVENTNACNARCVFCPYPGMKRKHTVMSLELHRKIVDEAATIPLFDLFTITGLGEPLLDKNLVEKVRYTREKMDPAVCMDVYTNGSTLTVEKAKELHEAGLGTLMISLNATRREKRREIMGLDDYDHVIDTIRKVIDEVPGLQVVVKAIVTKDLMEGDEQIEFVKNWGGRVGEGGKAFIHLEGNWCGKIYKVRTTQSVPCSRALSSIMVLADGRVCLCCQDAEGEVIFGDLNHETLRDIYQKKQYVELRQKHIDGKRSELFLCKDCCMI